MGPGTGREDGGTRPHVPWTKRSKKSGNAELGTHCAPAGALQDGTVWPEHGVAAVCAGAALSLVAAMVHLWAVPDHAWMWWGYGVFFLAAALSQGLFGVALLRWPSQPLAVAGICGNLSVVLLYVLTRTSGVPYGPHTGKVEDVGLLDMTATFAEMGLVVVLVTMLSGAYRRVTTNALLLLGVAIWALRLTGFLS